MDPDPIMSFLTPSVVTTNAPISPAASSALLFPPRPPSVITRAPPSPAQLLQRQANSPYSNALRSPPFYVGTNTLSVPLLHNSPLGSRTRPSNYCPVSSYELELPLTQTIHSALSSPGMDRHRIAHHVPAAVEFLDVVSVDQDTEDGMDGYASSAEDTELLLRLQDASRADMARSMHHLQQMPSTPPPPARPIIKRDRGAIGISQQCSVCEVMTNGFHFGAVSCAACSAFFRRTVAENRSYVCRKEGDLHLKCPINQSARCYCRACRLQKCLQAGMDPTAVQPHRDVIGSSKKRKASSEHSQSPLGLKQEAGESLADHLKMNREFSRALKAEGGYHLAPSPTQKKISPTAHLLTSTNNLAEQLLAFSRQPIVPTSNHDRIDPTTIPSTSSYSMEEIVRRGPSILGVKTDEEHANGINELHRMRQLHHDEGMEGRQSAYEYDDVDGEDGMIIAEGSNIIVDVNESWDEESDPSGVNMVEALVANYEKLRERRRLIYCPPTIKDILGGTKPQPRDASFYERIKYNMRVEVGLVAELLMATPLFCTLPLDDQVLLFKNVSAYFNVMEKHYYTMLNGGVQSNMIIHNDNTYTDLNNTNFIKQARPDKDETMTDEVMHKLFIEPLRHSVRILAGSMEKIRMTDVEFCGLVAVLLFDPTIAGLSEEGRAMVLDGRNQAYKDWFGIYRINGFSRDEGARRVGETLLLIPAVQSTAELSKENFHMIRVFQCFEYDDLLDDIFDSKPAERAPCNGSEKRPHLMSEGISP